MTPSLTSLLREIEALRADAYRWRWFCEQAVLDATLQTAIDAALADRERSTR